MILILDPNNMLLLFMQLLVICVPLSVLTLLLFLVIRKIPSRWMQGLVPLIAGFICAVMYLLMETPVPGNYFVFLIGILIHPLLLLIPPVVFNQYLQRIPVPWAVFFTALISLVILMSAGAMQGDLRYVSVTGVVLLWEGGITVMKDLLVGSIAFGLILILDSIL